MTDTAAYTLAAGLGAAAIVSIASVIVQHMQRQAERERLEEIQAANRVATRREAERQILDEGAALATRFRIEMQSVQRSERRVWRHRRGQRDVPLPPSWEAAVGAVTVFRGRLRLWFDDQSEVAVRFDEIFGLIRKAADLRLGREPPGALSVDEAVAGVLRQLDEAETLYLTAARNQLLF
jgi:hypothetical protein